MYRRSKQVTKGSKTSAKSVASISFNAWKQPHLLALFCKKKIVNNNPSNIHGDLKGTKETTTLLRSCAIWQLFSPQERHKTRLRMNSMM
jgi:hypothetical protein